MSEGKLGWIPSLSALQLDIVGIVAILGEGCITRTSQASALSWLHVIPRLLPAPQALLKHEQEARLPARPGFVVGIYSGNFKAELNFFTHLLHHESLARNEVQLLSVKKVTKSHDEENCTSCSNGDHCRLKQAFQIKTFGAIGILSLVGCAMAGGLIAGAVVLRDGFALLATLLLAMTSTIVGYASWWNLEFEEEHPKSERKTAIPDGDVVIYYPTGAFRVVRCDEEVSRLYFKSEVCKQVISDNLYRILALVASAFLMAGLLCMSNAHIKMQISLAACYISLNMLHWAVSAMKPYKHWDHDYEVKVLPFDRPKLAAPLTIAKGVVQTHNAALLPVADLRPVAHEALPTSRTQNTPPQSDQVPQSSSPTADQDTTASGHKANLGTDDSMPTAVQARTSVNNDGPRSEIPQERSKVTHISSNHSFPAGLSQSNDRIRRRTHTDLEADKSRESKFSAFGTNGILRRLIRRATTVVEDPSTDGFVEDRRFTAALWQVIALTANGKWLHRTTIAPATPVWTKWIDEAHDVAKQRHGLREVMIPAWTEDPHTRIVHLPKWDYQGALTRLLKEQSRLQKLRPSFFDVVMKARTPNAQGVFLPDSVIVRLRRLADRARERVRLKQQGLINRSSSWLALSNDRQNRNENSSAVGGPIRPITKSMRQLTLKAMFARNSKANSPEMRTDGISVIPLGSLGDSGSQDASRSRLAGARDGVDAEDKQPGQVEVVETT